MALELYESEKSNSDYIDKHSSTNLKHSSLIIIELSPEEYERALKRSTTLYMGNLSFFTQDYQVLSLFSKCGEIKSLIMGINKKRKVPCGFCFMEYRNRESACLAYEYLNNTLLDGRMVRLDWDIGFSEGRQFGRGRTGAQVRDELSEKQDKERSIPHAHGASGGGGTYGGRGGYRGRNMRRGGSYRRGGNTSSRYSYSRNEHHHTHDSYSSRSNYGKQ